MMQTCAIPWFCAKRLMKALVIWGTCVLSVVGCQDQNRLTTTGAPIEQLMISAGEWTYSPVNPVRERYASFLYLAQDGQAFTILGSLFEETIGTPSGPAFSTNGLFKLDLGQWRLDGNTVRLDLHCLGSMYVLAAEGSDPCHHSTLVLRLQGMNLLGDGDPAYEPIAAVYTDRWRDLQKAVFASSCKNARVSAAFKQCRN